MSFKETFAREKYVVIHGQPRLFRVIKYIVLVSFFSLLWVWKGSGVTLKVFGALVIVGVATHFIFRWKTNNWTKSWGPYKRLPDLPR